ncbi:MAG: hypothetical protein RL450_28 [Actinomycetota bacterium]
MKTFQLRRYELDPQLADEFVAWVHQDVMPIRQQFGFQAEWMYLSIDKTELTWLASLDGDEEHFKLVEAEYSASEARSQAAAKMPRALIKANVSFVTSSL